MNQISLRRDIITQSEIGIDLYSRYISYLDATPKTVETYKKSLKQLFLYFSDNGIRFPQREDIISFREHLVSAGLKPTTIQNYITVTKLFFKWTAQEGIYPDIADHIKTPKIDREHKKDYLTTKQAKEVLTSVDRNTLKGARDYAILTLMITGGLRTIEVVRANVGDLRTVGDFTVLYIQGKGRTEKTEYVKISEQVEKAIRSYLSIRGQTKDNDPLFASTSHNNNGERITTRAVSGLVKDRLKLAGYDSARLTAHSLRHTAVTLSLLAGKDITEVQQFARHSNIATTMIYNHALDKAKNGCADAISQSIF